MRKSYLKSQEKTKLAFQKMLILFFLFGLCSNAYAQKNINGNVKDGTGEPIIGASVLVKGAQTGTVTDLDGNFTINVSNNAVLVISYIGYLTQEISVAGKSVINVLLKEDTELLDELVVVGYGTQRKVNATGAISTVGGQTFVDKGVVSSPIQALQGQVPGMTVSRASTAPGREGWDFKIRGEASVNNTSALVLIDGVPGELNDINPDDIENISVLKDASASIYGARAAGGVVLVTTKRGQNSKPQASYKGNVSLKVPASTYKWMNMSQWARYTEERVYNNGYIHNNSSRFGQAGAFPYTMIYAMKTMDPRLIGTVQGFADMGGTGAGIRDIGFFDYDPYNDTFETAVSYSHSLSVKGGNENVKYNVSIGYMYDDSPLAYGIEDNSKRYNARANNDFKINQYFDISTSLAFDRRNSVWPLFRPSGSNGNPPGSPTFTKYGGPYGWENNMNDAAKAKFGGNVFKQTDNFSLSIQPKIHIMKGLDLNLLASLYSKSYFNKEYQNRITWEDYEGEPYGFYDPSQNTFRRDARNDIGQNYQAYLNYDTDFATGKTHNFSSMLGTSYEKESSESFVTDMKNFPEALLHSFSEYDAEITDLTATDAKWDVALASYFARLNYNYNGRYLVELLGRYDGSSRFVKGKKWKPFLGASVGWRISEENFMKEWGFFDNLKIRASYGEVGNQLGIDRYDFVPLINSNVSSGITHGYPLFGADATAGSTQTQTYTQRNVVSLDRTWEKIITKNIGLDFAFLDNRLNGTFEVFRRENKNMLVSVVYPAVLGATAPKTNHGELRVDGWELSLGWRDKIGKDFAYNIGVNISDAKNKLIAMPNADRVTTLNARTDYLVGYPLRSYWGMRYDKIIENDEELQEYKAKLTGTNAANYLPQKDNVSIGDAKYKDVNGDGYIDYDDIDYLGDATLRYNYGINLDFAYKGFDLGLIFQGVGKANIIRAVDSYVCPGRNFYQVQGAQYYDITWGGQLANDPNMVGENAFFTYMGETVYPTAADYRTPYLNAHKAYPRWSGDTQTYNTEIYSDAFWRLQNMAYCRLKNLIIGYTLPKSIARKLNIEYLRVNFTGTDLFTISFNRDGTDPENMSQNVFGGTNGSAAYPFSRTFSFGIDLTF